MSYNSITTFLHNPSSPLNALDYAIAAARRWDAHLHVVCAGIDTTNPGFFYAGAQAIALQTNLEEAQHTASQMERVILAKLKTEDIRWDVQTVTMMATSVTAFLSDHMRFCDLAIMPLPYGDQRSEVNVAVFEACVFGANIPVLVVPDSTKWHFPPRRVLVAWDQGVEALAAARAAIPFAKAADLTEICMIDPPRTDSSRSDPGGRLAQVLVRSGVQAEISVISKTKRTIAKQLDQRAIETQSDMIVMGAYGHSRLREAVMGGVTRTMLRQASVPILMAH